MNSPELNYRYFIHDKKFTIQQNLLNTRVAADQFCSCLLVEEGLKDNQTLILTQPSALAV